MARVRIVQIDENAPKKVQKLQDLDIRRQLKKYKILTYILFAVVSIQFYYSQF